MTWAASAWALTVTMPTSSKFVLLVLANFTDEHESCFPGVPRLAETTGYSERSIKSCLALLEHEGLISRERRYTRFGGRTSDRYVLHVGRLPRAAADSAADTPADSSTSGAVDALGADFAPNAAHEPVDNSQPPLGAESAPDGFGPVDNPLPGSPLGATDAPLGATGAPLKEEHPDRTTRSSSSTEVTTEAPASDSEAAALPPDDDDGEFDGGGGDSAALVDDGLGAWAPSGHSRRATIVEPTPPVVQAAAGPVAPSGRDGELEGRPSSGDESESADLRVLLRAGIEVSLRELDARLNLSEILRRLSDAGVDGERVDIPTAASFALGASVRPVGDPSAYVAAAIIREPTRWPWSALPGAAETGGGPRRSTCELEGHRYLDEFRMQCVRCDEERPGWREERYANEHSPAVAS